MHDWAIKGKKSHDVVKSDMKTTDCCYIGVQKSATVRLIIIGTVVYNQLDQDPNTCISLVALTVVRTAATGMPLN